MNHHVTSHLKQVHFEQLNILNHLIIMYTKGRNFSPLIPKGSIHVPSLCSPYSYLPLTPLLSLDSSNMLFYFDVTDFPGHCYCQDSFLAKDILGGLPLPSYHCLSILKQMLSVNQGSNTYHFKSLWYDLARIRTSALPDSERTLEPLRHRI